MNSHIENLLPESLPGNNLTPRDLKSTDRFTAEKSTMRKREGKSEKRLGSVEGDIRTSQDIFLKAQLLLPQDTEGEEYSGK